MASQSILRAGVKSPRTFIKPRSILKRPAPLPLSPNPMQFTASFSVVINSSHLSPHVHFPSSPGLAATFTAYSANTYDRGAPMMLSPGSTPLSPILNRALSPSAYNAFKLLDPPKRSNINNKAKAQAKANAKAKAKATASVTSSAERRTTATPPQNTQSLLTVPAFEDPRSPKPYKSRSGVSFEELTIHVPRGTITRKGGARTEELGRALSTYPRSPYPSAPIEEDVSGSDSSSATQNRGRWPTPNNNTTNTSLKPPAPFRARSLENTSTMRRQSKHVVFSPLKPNFLSPVRESQHHQNQHHDQQQRRHHHHHVPVTKPAPLDLEGLSQAFWQSVSVEEPLTTSEYHTAHETVSLAPSSAHLEGLKSPVQPNIMFGNKDGSLWSPRVPPRRSGGRTVIGGTTRLGGAAEEAMLSPAQRAVFSKGMVASPTPNDPFAAFPSFSIALMSMDGIITYPPRARV